MTSKRGVHGVVCVVMALLAAVLSVPILPAPPVAAAGPPPANDDFATADDLSALEIPAYIADPFAQPVDVVSATGTTVDSTREPLEYGTLLNPDGTETPPPTGTVWYRFTAPVDGFSGRLGYRVSPGFTVTPLSRPPGATGPATPASGDVGFAPGNTWPPTGLSFVRMEPGHTVWFQVQAVLGTDSNGTDVWFDGEFTLELFQSPNEQDDIAVAYDIQGADRPDGSGRPWTDPLGWSGDGDTFHTTTDQPGGPGTMWFTATFDRTGRWSFSAASETADGRGSARPLGVRLYRAPTPQRVSSPATLTPVASSSGSLVSSDAGFGYQEPFWLAVLEAVSVQPGRYYWSVDQGAAGPTFYGLRSTFVGEVRPPDTTPPTITISGVAPGQAVTTASPVVTISSDEALFGIICTLDTPTPGGGTASNDIGCLADGATSGTLTLPDLPDGGVTLRVMARDAAGNDGQATLTFAVEVPPVATITAPVDGDTYAPGAVPGSVAYRCLDNSGVVTEEVQLVPPGGGLPSLLDGPLPNTPGTYTVRVLCVDGLGEEGAAQVTYTVTSDATVRVNAVNFQGTPITQLPTGAPPACAIGLFLVTNGTIAAAPTATACFGAGSPPAGAVFRVPPGSYVVTKTAQFALAPLSTGASLVTVAAGDDVTTDLTFFRPEVGAPGEPTAAPDTLTVRPGTSGSVNLLTNDTPSAPGEALSISIVMGPAKGQLAVGDGGSITYTAAAGASGTDTVTYDSVDPWGNRSRSTLTVTIQPWAQLGLTVSATPTPVGVGGLFQYVVEVTNPSLTDTAHGVRLRLVLPAGAGMTSLDRQPPLSGCSFSPALSGGASGTPAVTVDCTLADLAPNAVATLAVSARALAGTAGTTLAAAATLVSSDCLDVDPAAAGSQCRAPVIGGPDVTSATLVAEVAQVSPASGTAVRVGDLTTLRFRVVNSGTIAARSVRMVVTFPAEMGMTGLTAMPPLSSCNFSPSLSSGAGGTPAVTVTCSLPDLPPGEAREIEVQARVLDVPVGPAAPVRLDVGSGDCMDTSARPGIQCATAAGGPGVERVSLTPAVRVERVAGGTSLAVGDDVLVVATVRNGGGIPARSPTMRVALPAELGMTGVETMPSFAGCSFLPALSGGASGTPSVTVSCTLADLAASSTTTLVLRAKVLAVPGAGAPFGVDLEAGSRDCRDQTAGDGRRVCATAVAATPVVPLPTPGGVLTLAVRSLGGGAPVLELVQGVAPSLLGVVPPAGVGFPYGAMSFSIHDVPVGGSVTVDITTPSTVDGYWKLVNDSWSSYPGVMPIPGSATGLRLTLTDGGQGDADGVADGVIVDPGAVGVPNVGPAAPNRDVSTRTGTPVTVDVLAGATDLDGGVPEIVDTTDGAHGRVTATDIDVTYTPDPGTSGLDSFTVRIGDRQGGLAVVTVTVHVGDSAPPPPPPAVPVGAADAYLATAGTTLTVAAPGVLANDAGVGLTAQLVTPPATGTLTLQPDGGFTFVPPATASTITFSYRPGGPYGVGDVTTVTIVVSPAPPPPVLPALAVADGRVVEGNAGLRALTFTVTRSGSAKTTVWVGYHTAGGTASAWSDYLPAAGMLRLRPGETTATVTVLVLGDRRLEPDESVSLVLSTPVGARLGRATAVGTIVDDDRRPVRGR